jgi:hypothetical protein
MHNSSFIIMLARQRSGTNAVRSVLESHPDIYCHNEVFNLKDVESQDDPLLRETNYFNFVRRYANGDLARIHPDQHEKLFLDFLEYLRCFSSKRYMVIDVKYNTTHFLTQPYKWELAPYLFHLIQIHGLRVLNVTRRNYLRYVLSTLKAERSGVWAIKGLQGPPPDAKIRVELDYLFYQLRSCDAENKLIESSFAPYPNYLAAEYNDIFNTGSGALSPAFLDKLSNWLAVPNSYPSPSEYRKQSSLPLAQTIENFEEVAAALRGTEFAYCLDDETMYAPRPVAKTAPSKPSDRRRSGKASRGSLRAKASARTTSKKR